MVLTAEEPEHEVVKKEKEKKRKEFTEDVELQNI